MCKQSQRCALQSEGVFRVMLDNGGCIALVHVGLVYLVQYILYMCNYLSSLIYNIPSFKPACYKEFIS